MAAPIKLGTLKECLQFLQWLNKNTDMQDKVASELEKLLKGKYKTVSQSHIANALSTFLGNVSKFHTKLCKNANAVNNGKQDPTAVLNALLECIPKFLAVMYFLRYQVDDKFSAVGGGGWQNYRPGGGILRGGDLDKYLYAQPHQNNYGVIPGGFGRQELKPGYRQGSFMAGDLQNIVDKKDGANVQNYFFDVFATSVLGQHGTQDSNTANALALVRTFCGIVVNEQYNDKGGELLRRLNEHFKDNQNRICWNNLKEHCAKLQEQFRRIFADHRFSFTGFGRKHEELKKEEFADYTAQWLRGNLATVKDKLTKIDTTNKSPGKKSAAELTDYFTRNLFPYGFTFYHNDYSKRGAPYEDLKKDWDAVIDDFKRPSGGLDQLKTILEGQQCPPKKQEDEEPENKAEGAQNQGKKADGTPKQNNGQSEEKSPASTVVKATVPPPSPGDPGVQGPAGSPGPGGPGQGSPGNASPGPQPVDPPAPTLTQPPTVTGSRSESTGGQRTAPHGGKPTSHGVDETSSSGATAPDGTASGGGGSRYAYYIELC
ncbi:Ribosome-binding protein 1, putative [Babesia ovata]|uniref:Ribosome-binding protein 1, putative n=1 Tax=Babesia ovata TaxID=189622 RepID=A0A2H6KHM4_9APIC|nr:Ribosome-binding protein 1, putative [Babesia ovata]GBE62496.1 Ribosome-binding protein 1, putative [Babesia ovata]